MHQLESRSCGSSRGFRWLQSRPSKKQQGRTTPLSHSRICDSQTLWDCNMYCFKSANFGIIYYLTVTTNTKPRNIYFETKIFVFSKAVFSFLFFNKPFSMLIRKFLLFSGQLWISAMFSGKVRTGKWFHALYFKFYASNVVVSLKTFFWEWYKEQ